MSSPFTFTHKVSSDQNGTKELENVVWVKKLRALREFLDVIA